MQLDLQLVRRVRPWVDAAIRRTPIVETPRRGEQRLFWKLEGRQVTGSFKVRGPLALRALDASTRPWVTASAGNHGLGVAYAARGGTAPRIFVPRSSAEIKRQAIRRLGAVLEVCDTDGYDDTEARARAWARSHDGRFVSAFDDELIMAGNGGTLACEILEQLPMLDTLLVPIGGGGLASGAGCVVRCLQPGVTLIGVQSTRTSAMAESWKTGRAVLHQHAGNTWAEGLEGGVSERSFGYVRRWFDDVITVEEDAIGRAIAWLWHTLGDRAEGSAAVVAAALQTHRIPGNVVCAVLTGSNIDAARFESALRPADRGSSQGAS
jgi:threonine dehydratase